MIDHLTSQIADKDRVGVAYLYCDYRDQQNQTIVNILGSILRQLLLNSPTGKIHIPEELLNTLKAFQKQGKSVGTGGILAMLKITLQQFNYCFVCIDALDELQTTIRRKLLHILRNHISPAGSSEKTLRLFLTGRPHISQEINELLGISKGTHIIKPDHEDIKSYLTHLIQQDSIPQAMNDSLREEILDTIIAESQGM